MKNFFGTDGIRGKVGDWPFTQEDLIKLSKAIACWFLEKYGPNQELLLAQDTRQSCDWIKSTLKSNLLLHQINIADCGVLPTPAVFHLIKKNKQYMAAIVISASHNPYYDNGLKIIDSKNNKLSKQDETRIIEFLGVTPFEQNNFIVDYNKLGSERYLCNAANLYSEIILTLFNKLNLKSKTILLDTANGAASRVAPEIFKSLGANVITLNNTPDGYNINQDCGSLHPEKLRQAVLENNADIGFAFDGDGDRVIAVNKVGDIKDGDDILALLAQNNDYSKSPSIVGTIMTNVGLEVYLKDFNKTLIRTPVGDKYVTEALNINNLYLGGEQSGHIILNNIINTADGIVTALKILETLEYINNWDFSTFKKYPQVQLNIPVKVKKTLEESPIKEIINEHNSRLIYGRLIIRYSGTENLLRIMVEAQDLKQAQTIAE